MIPPNERQPMSTGAPAKQPKLVMSLRTLRRTLATVASAVDRRPTIPALAAVRIKQEPGEVELAGTSPGVSIVARTHLKNAGAADPIFMGAHKLKSYVDLLEYEDVSLQAAGTSKAILRCGGAETAFATLPSGEFPHLEPAPTTKAISLDRDIVSRMLKFTSFAICKDGNHGGVCGALLEVSDGAVHLVATDGHRLAKFSAAHADTATSMVLPADLLAAVGNTIDTECNGACEFALSDSRVFVTISDRAGVVEFSHRKIGGGFPRYRAILPTNASATVTLPAAALVGAIRRCMTVADSKARVVELCATPSQLKLRAGEASSGLTAETLAVSSSGSFPPYTSLFRGEYLLDALVRIKGDVTIGFTKVGATDGAWIVHEPLPGERFEYVVMGLKH